MVTTPWGLTRMGSYSDTGTGTVPLLVPVLDPETQVAVLIDEHGRTVELGEHGTSTNTSTTTQTGSADGQNPGGSDQDSVPANDQD
ncbi:putative ATP-grasp-modified RiPP [Kitasatospora phosalacinea]|uniref:ATP-grasp-modified RiPP n=1 Tax=Kitasatospora phosalacinea TaxID=2065 RepID=A0A9W6PFJ3_9ACTN|nr:putative ATP-grasp-modified RiPP [Kitasatospora phosalacinea]GLW53988.1 hypothetical protein Kpho01_19990 [Kitasatospora phosalacinea]